VKATNWLPWVTVGYRRCPLMTDRLPVVRRCCVQFWDANFADVQRWTKKMVT
jgi:hypothetical protein